MRIRVKLVKTLMIVTLCCALAGLVAGCSGSDSEKAVRKTIEDLTDKSSVDAGNMLKKQINVLTDQQVEKAKEGLENQEQKAEDPEGEGK